MVELWKDQCVAATDGVSHVVFGDRDSRPCFLKRKSQNRSCRYAFTSPSLFV